MGIKGMGSALLGMGLLMLVPLQGAAAGKYDHEIKDQKMTFAWKVDGDTLAVKLTAETDGWVGIGFNPSKGMKDANYILGYVKDGETKLTDEFGDTETTHVPDDKLGGSSDVTLVGGSEQGGVTTVEFTLPLKSADKYDGTINGAGDNIILLAYGGGRDSFKTKHKYRNTLQVNFASGASQKAK